MSDNTEINPGSGGDTLATDDIGGVKYPRGKTGFGGDGSYTEVADASTGLPVRVSDGTSAFISPATSGKQDTGNTSLASLDTKTPALGQALAAASVPVVLTAAQITTLTPLTSIAVTNAGTFACQAVQSGVWNITNISGTVSLPTGAATAAKQPALGTAGTASTDVITIQGIASGTVVPVSDGGGSITVDGTFWQATQPVSGTIAFSNTTIAVTNAGTFAVQLADGANTTLGAKADAKSTATDTTAISAMSVLKQISASVQAPPSQAVTNAGTFAVQATQSGTWNVTNVSGTISLPTGASTAVKQPALGTAGTASSDVITVQGIASMTALKVDNSAVTQPINISQINSIGASSGGSAGSLSVGGGTSSGGILTAYPLNLGAQAVSSENAVVATSRLVQLVSDLAGKLITLPYANPENFISGTTSAGASTANQILFSSQGAGLRSYLTSFQFANSSGTDCLVDIKDGTNVVTTVPVPANTAAGGCVFNLPVPLRMSAATAVNVAAKTSLSTIYMSAQGYKGT